MTIPTETTKPYNQGSKRIFKSFILEKLSKTHIAVPISIFVIIGTALIYYGMDKGLITTAEGVLSFLAGVLAFTWVEYNVHRHLFHMLPKNGLGKNLQYAFHGVHHEYPKDKSRLAMPPLVSILIVSVLFVFFRLVLGDYIFGFLPGFIVGYAAYLLVHYSVHAFKPPKNFFKILWIHHAIHHYKHSNKAYGVSSPLWDYIYGTMPPR